MSKKENMKMIKIQFIIIFLLLACPVLARESGSEPKIDALQFGDYSVEYDLSEKIDNYHTIYKKEGQIVLSVFDADENGKPDLWLRYGKDLVLNLEASDSDGDGEADTFVTLDADENAVKPST